MNKIVILLFTVVIVSVSSCNAQKISDSKAIEPVDILFIGNSLSYTNNLPKLVEKTAELEGILVNTKMIAKPNYAIIDHWNDGDIKKLISTKTFDFVIVQQGPSSQKEGRQMLIEDGKKYSQLCKENGSRLCYFMVWPSLTYFHTFDDVIKNHQHAAKINDAILLPVGKVWKDFIDKTNNYEYYSSDGFHPSKKGSLVAAQVIVDSLLINLK